MPTNRRWVCMQVRIHVHMHLQPAPHASISLDLGPCLALLPLACPMQAQVVYDNSTVGAMPVRGSKSGSFQFVSLKPGEFIQQVCATTAVMVVLELHDTYATRPTRSACSAHACLRHLHTACV